MPAKKTALTDAERAKRIREAAREHETSNDPAAFERAFKAVVSSVPKSPFPAHTRPDHPVGGFTDDLRPLAPLPPMRKPDPKQRPKAKQGKRGLKRKDRRS
jgi:hypothetical protein